MKGDEKETKRVYPFEEGSYNEISPFRLLKGLQSHCKKGLTISVSLFIFSGKNKKYEKIRKDTKRYEKIRKDTKRYEKGFYRRRDTEIVSPLRTSFFLPKKGYKAHYENNLCKVVTTGK